MSHNTKSSLRKKASVKPKFVNPPFKGSSPMYSLNKDVIGYLLSLLSYHDWATLQRTAQLFHHKEHDRLRKNAKKLLEGTSDIALEPIHCYLGRAINLSTDRLEKELSRVFSHVPKCNLQGEIILSSLLNLPFTGMHIRVNGMKDYAGVLSQIKLDIRRVTFKYSEEQNSTLVIDCQDGYRIIVDTGDGNIPFKFRPKAKKAFTTDQYGVRTLMNGLALWRCYTIYDYRRLTRYGLKASNLMAITSHESLFGVFRCQHDFYAPDARGVCVSPGVRFIFEAPPKTYAKPKKCKVAERLLILADYKGYKMDALTRQLYNPETKAICGKVSKTGAIKLEKCIPETAGDTEHRALKPKKCSSLGRCGHPFIYRRCEKEPENDLFNVDCPEMWFVLGTKEQALKYLKECEGDEDSLVSTMRDMESCNALLSDQVLERLGKDKKYSGIFDSFCDDFPSASENNFEFWEEEFNKFEGRQWLRTVKMRDDSDDERDRMIVHSGCDKEENITVKLKRFVREMKHNPAEVRKEIKELPTQTLRMLNEIGIEITKEQENQYEDLMQMIEDEVESRLKTRGSKKEDSDSEEGFNCRAFFGKLKEDDLIRAKCTVENMSISELKEVVRHRTKVSKEKANIYDAIKQLAIDELQERQESDSE